VARVRKLSCLGRDQENSERENEQHPREGRTYRQGRHSFHLSASHSRLSLEVLQHRLTSSTATAEVTCCRGLGPALSGHHGVHQQRYALLGDVDIPVPCTQVPIWLLWGTCISSSTPAAFGLHAQVLWCRSAAHGGSASLLTSSWRLST
jgi:hypothetical protein